jgi:outer membrane PBP1 activator LpoA protein
VQDLLHQGGFSTPVLALNYTDTWGLPSNFYEFGLSVQDETQQLADKARQAGRSSAIIIAPQNDWGQRNVKSLVARWNSLGGSVSDTFYFNDQTDLNQGIASLMHIDTKADMQKMKKENNKTILEQQRRQDFNVIFLFATPEMARQIVPLLKYYYANHVPIYATSAVYSGNPSPQDSDLNGVIFSDIPWVFSANNRSNRLYAVGRDAYLLINQIPRMRQLPNFPLYGATGALTLTSQQQVYRRVAWVQMHDGHP